MSKQEFRRAMRRHLGDELYRQRVTEGWTIKPCPCGKDYCEGFAFAEPTREVMGDESFQGEREDL